MTTQEYEKHEELDACRHPPCGAVTVSDKGETFFTPSPTGNIRYQLPGSKAWAAQMLEKIRNANRQR